MQHIQTKSTSCFRWKRWCRTNWAVFASLRCFNLGVLSVSMSILAQHSAFAHDADTTAVSKTIQIQEVAVTGVRETPVSSVRTVVNPTVIGRGFPVRTLESALRLVPSADVRERGGKGTQADISIRGGSFDQTAVSLNGIDFTDVRTGHQSHSLPIDFDCVSRVVIGEAGAGAFAGSVNVFTEPLRPDYVRLDASGGQYGYAYGNLSGAATGKKATLFGAASYRRSDGYRHNTDFDTYNAFLRTTYDTEHLGSFDFQAGYQNRAFGSNGFYAAYNPDQWEHTSTALGSLRWRKQAGRFSLGSSASYRKNFDRYDWTRGKAMNLHNTDNVGAQLWSDFRWRGGTTSLRSDYAFNHIYSTNLGEKMSKPHGDYTHSKARHTGDVLLNHSWSENRWTASGSVGASITPYGTAPLWGVTAGRQWRLFSLDAGAVRSLRLPTFTDLYYSSPAQINNLDLTPEYATTYYVNSSYLNRRLSLSLRGYYRAGRDIIDWVWREDMGNKWHSEQTSRLDTYGVEFVGLYHLNRGFLRTVRVTYAYINTDRTSKVVAKSAMDFLRHKAALTLGTRFLKRFTFDVTGSVSDRNGSYTAYPKAGDSSVVETRDFKPFFLLDASLAWEKGWCRLYVDASNITDTSYCDLGGIPLPGAWVTGGVTLTFGK